LATGFATASCPAEDSPDNKHITANKKNQKLSSLALRILLANCIETPFNPQQATCGSKINCLAEQYQCHP
jgi:hypothetical protein